MKKCLLLILVGLSVSAWCATDAQLKTQITSLQAQVSSLTATVTSLSTDQTKLVSKLQATNALSSPLIVGGIVISKANTTISLPITFISSGPVSALQFDLVLPANVTFVSATPGAVTTAAGKSISTAALSGAERFIVAGLNQSTFGTGSLMTVSLTLSAGIPTGNYPVILSNPAASDLLGRSAPLSVTSGILEVTP